MGSVPEIALDNVEIVGFEVIDLRFPTSLDGVGSDAMHVGTNGSHPYVRLLTNQPGLVGEGIVRTPPSLPSLPPRLPHLNNEGGYTLTLKPLYANRPSAMAAAASSSAWRSTSSRGASSGAACPR
jgi:hypothetical protein